MERVFYCPFYWALKIRCNIKEDFIMKREKTTVKNIGYSLTGELQLSLKGCPYLIFVKPEELHYGGKNCEIAQLVVGSKIMFDYDGVEAVRHITNVTIMSDGIMEVDEEGNLIKW